MTQKHNSKNRQGKSRWYVRLFRWYVANGPFAPYPELPSQEHLERRLEIDKNAPGRWAWSVREWQQELTLWAADIGFRQIAAIHVAALFFVPPVLFVFATGLIPILRDNAEAGWAATGVFANAALILVNCSAVKLVCVIPTAFANLPGLSNPAWVRRFLRAQAFCLRLRLPAQAVAAVVTVWAFDWKW